MKKSLSTLVILATGSALLLSGSSCERKQRTPSAKSSAAQADKKAGTASAPTTQDAKKPVATAPTALKDSSDLESELKALAEMMKANDTQKLVSIKGTQTPELFMPIADASASGSEYEASDSGVQGVLNLANASILSTMKGASDAEKQA
ncbi:MAG: hypothetical protein EOP09_16425, partial [Proteobacteria bacterium]